MASSDKEPHFILFPLMAQGHMIPMVDIARILAQRGVLVTIITTPANANRFKSVFSRAIEAKLPIRVHELQFPSTEAGLPEGCENFDMLPSPDLMPNMFVWVSMLQEPVEKLLQEVKPTPSCLISDMWLPWTMDVARKSNLPRLVFTGFGCFSLLCIHNLMSSGILDDITSNTENFVIPGLPDQVEITKAKLEGVVTGGATPMREFLNKIREAEKEAHGFVVNSAHELELDYAKEYAKAKGKNVWCVGPVSLFNKNNLDVAERGNKAAIDGHHCLEWLDKWDTSSVVYVCLGSLSRLSTAQAIELGLGLELSNRPFIWCLQQQSEEMERWFSEEGFEERVKERSLIVRGWAPQVLILSHQAIGGFLTHCGWNSTLEGLSVGVPFITWPRFGEQFLNEKFIVEMWKIGVRIGAEVTVGIGGQANTEVLIKRDDIQIAVDSLMDGGEEGEVKRRRARELRDMAKAAMEEGGSSHLSMTLLIQDIIEQASC